MVRLLQAAIDGVLNTEPEEIKAFVRAGAHHASATAAATPCKRVKLSGNKDGKEDDTGAWPEAERIINGALTRLSSIEGSLGVPPKERTAMTLWGGQEHMENRLLPVEAFLETLPATLNGLLDSVAHANRTSSNANQQVQGFIGTGGANTFLQPLALRLDAVERLSRAQGQELLRLGQANADLTASME